MSNVSIDIIEGHRGRFTQRGWEIERLAKLYNLTGIPGYQKMNEAKNEILAYVGGIGSPIDAINLPNVTLEEIVPEAEASDAFILRLIYRQRGPTDDQPAIIEIGATVQQVQTNKNSDGKLIVVSYNDGTATQKQSGTIPAWRPNTTLSFTRLETSSPGDKAKQYVGKTNDTNWSIDPTAPKNTWMCTGIVGRSKDGGRTFEVTYSFQYKEEGWTAEVIYIDPATGRAPPDAITDASNTQDYGAIGDVQGQVVVDLNGLSLTA